MVAQIQHLTACKAHFCDKVEILQANIELYEQQVETSIEELQGKLIEYVQIGAEEAKNALSFEKYENYQNAVGRELNHYGIETRLITWETDLNEAFHAIETAVNNARVRVKVTCPGMLGDFKYEGNVELVGNSEANKGWKRVKRWQIMMLVSLIMCGFGASLWKGGREMVFESEASREKYTNLGVYDGGNGEGRLNWKDLYEFKSGNKYFGQWKGDSTLTAEEHISGYGTMSYVNGDIYEGYWRQGKRHGNGRLITRTGDVCEGMWKQDEFTGWGCCAYADNTVKSGEWAAGELDGFGSVSTSKSISMGVFSGGELSELGVKFTSPNEFIVGMWGSGKYDGLIVEFNKSQVMWGRYLKGELQGNMTVIEENGVKYVGEWSDGYRQGNGVEAYPAEYLTGQWSRGSVVSGIYNYADIHRIRYERHLLSLPSPCRLISPSASLTHEHWLFNISECNSEGNYTGQVNTQGLRHGHGTQTYANGTSYTGYWMNDKQNICPETNSFKNMKLEDGMVKTGESKDGKLHGIGRLMNNNSVAIGEFSSDQLTGLGLTYTNNSEFSAGNWASTGTSILKVNSSFVYWEQGHMAIPRIRPSNLTERALKRVIDCCFEWSISTPNQVETATFRTNRNILVTGIQLGNRYQANSYTSVSSIKIIEGNSTAGKVIYEHPRAEMMETYANAYPMYVKINLQWWVMLKADRDYTLRVKYPRGVSVYGGFGYVDTESVAEVVKFRFGNAILSQGETGRNSDGRGPIFGVYFVPN